MTVPLLPILTPTQEREKMVASALKQGNQMAIQ
jgi:hypothetical protein